MKKTREGLRRALRGALNETLRAPLRHHRTINLELSGDGAIDAKGKGRSSRNGDPIGEYVRKQRRDAISIVDT